MTIEVSNDLRTWKPASSSEAAKSQYWRSSPALAKQRRLKANLSTYYRFVSFDGADGEYTEEVDEAALNQHTLDTQTQMCFTRDIEGGLYFIRIRYTGSGSLTVSSGGTLLETYDLFFTRDFGGVVEVGGNEFWSFGQVSIPPGKVTICLLGDIRFDEMYLQSQFAPNEFALGEFAIGEFRVDE